MSTPKAAPPPAAPDPTATARQQADLTRQSAITQFGLGATNQVTPSGNLTYEQIGTMPDGTPRFQATQTLSPSQQVLYDQSVGNQAAIGRIGTEQIGRVGSTLGQPIEVPNFEQNATLRQPPPTLTLGNEATEARLWELGRKRLDPYFEQQNAALENRLVNQGLARGSEAFRQAMTEQGQTRNDAYNQLLLTGRGQAAAETGQEYQSQMAARNQALDELMKQYGVNIQGRNQPLNEITAFISGSQVTPASFVNTPQPQVAAPNYQGLVSQNYNTAMDQYNQQLAQQTAQQNAMMGGIFGTAGALGGGLAAGQMGGQFGKWAGGKLGGIFG